MEHLVPWDNYLQEHAQLIGFPIELCTYVYLKAYTIWFEFLHTFTWRFPGTICLPSAWEEALKIASGNVDVLSCLRMVIRLKNRVPKELCISSCVAPQLIWSYKYRPWLWVEPKRVKRSLGWVIWKHVQIHGYELFIIIIPFLPSSHIAMQLFSHTSHRVALGSQQKISENDCCESSRPQTVTVQGHRVLVWVRD